MKRQALVYSVFLGVVFVLALKGAQASTPTPAPSPVPTCTMTTVDCSECQAYRCGCVTSSPESVDVTISQLPFKKSIPDPNSSNSSCGAGVTGSCQCDGTYEISFNQLPLQDSRCSPKSAGGEKRLTTELRCQKQDSACQPVCSNWVQKTCNVCR